MADLAQWLVQLATEAGLTAADISSAANKLAEQKCDAKPSPSDSSPILGPPSDWALDGPYQCLVCRDARWVRHDVAVGHPDFGRIVACACTTEHADVRQARYRERLGTSGLPVALHGARLDTFQPVDPTTTHAQHAVRDFIAARHSGGTPAWITLFGRPGCGKSHLLAAAANALLPRQAVTYWAVPDLLRACKAAAYVDGAYRPFAEDQQLTETAKHAAVLLLDEFGAPAAEREWQWEKLDLLLKHRYAARAPLVLGMTCSPQELQTTAPALMSRLTDKTLGRVVVIEAPDYRPQLERARPAIVLST